ncbi:MAG: cardiolipin synthase [Lachnoclostridium sp.]|nr:cardiolipin synthase [Lachnospira sp.]MCM1249066.1 cardiolipin synthase [Lachnoclostridium sp.]MCM1535805.1 cardiolipin synthase [Clostridium sp.]
MKTNENITRLIASPKKGIFRIVFSRVGLVVVLLLLQLNILLSLYGWFAEYFQWFAGAQALFSIGMVFYLFNCDMDFSAKLTWLALIMLFPIPATIMLWFTENEIGHKAVKERVGQMIRDSMEKLPQSEETVKKPEIINSGTDDLCRYVNRSGCFPLWENTEVTYFPLGEDKFAALLEELKKAEKFIFLEYFIIEEGFMWGSILKILEEKAKQGVDVRVMYDGMCEISLLTSDYPKRLAKLGIKSRPFSPIKPFISTHYNYRDHRKILVIDNKVAFNGGVNLADEYINKVEKFGHWKDTAVMLKGEAVSSFTLMFLQMWNISEREPKWDEYLTPVKSEKSSGFVMPYCDCPLDEYKVGESVYMDILYRAKSYVHIMTPYLILDNELETALKYAAQRGVDVKLILPGIPDKKPVYALAKSHYGALLKAGVKIYEYTPGFVHAKVFVSDDEKGVVGTINLDYRSLYHHFECATYLYRTGCIAEIEEDFEKTLGMCRVVTAETIKHEKFSYKVMGGFLKLFAPLL